MHQLQNVLSLLVTHKANVEKKKRTKPQYSKSQYTNSRVQSWGIYFWILFFFNLCISFSLLLVSKISHFI